MTQQPKGSIEEQFTHVESIIDQAVKELEAGRIPDLTILNELAGPFRETIEASISPNQKEYEKRLEMLICKVRDALETLEKMSKHTPNEQKTTPPKKATQAYQTAIHPIITKR